MMKWQPTTILRFVRGFPSSACTALVETDAGKGYVKALGAPEGPHTLASEWVATQLAAWFGLPTFDNAIIEVTDLDEIPFYKGGHQIGRATPGPAFISRREAGEPWSGDPAQLKLLTNPHDINRLVAFDTWTLNCDRYSWPEGNQLGMPRINRDNVFLSEEAPAGQFILKAMDHTHCFSCGRPLTRKLSQIDTIRDRRLFGRFPAFAPYMQRAKVEQAISDLRKIGVDVVQSMMRTIPREWDVPSNVQDALTDLILGRAAFVADNICGKLWPQGELPFEEAEDVT